MKELRGRLLAIVCDVCHRRLPLAGGCTAEWIFERPEDLAAALTRLGWTIFDGEHHACKTCSPATAAEEH